jgi:tetratricopeptide (TPR) repeat protein
MSWDRSGHSFAFSADSQSKAIVLDPDHPEHRVGLGPEPGMDFVALSPDGRFVATSTWHPTLVKVWDARTGQFLRGLARNSHAPVFSPDGRWLAVHEDGAYRLYEVGTWRPGPTIPMDWVTGRVAFSADGRLLAFLDKSTGLVKLYSIARARVVATLQPPDFDDVNWIAFRPDGAQLAVATYAQTVQLWDLRVIRSRLRSLGLDWDASEPLAPDRSSEAHDPLIVRIEGGQPTLPTALVPSTPEQQIERLRAVVRTNPKNASVWFYLGELLWQRDRRNEAIDAFQEAVRNDGDKQAAYRFRLGIALRDAGRLEEALEAFRAIRKLKPGDDTAGFLNGESLLGAGRLDEAAAAFRELAADLAKAVAKEPDSSRARHSLGVALLLAGDREGYRRACASVIEHFGDPESVRSSDVPRACLLAPDAVPDFRVPLRMAEASLKPQAFAWTYYTLALAHLRAGQPADAIKQAQQSLALDPNWHAKALNTLVIALAYAQLGDTKKARYTLDPIRPTPGASPRNRESAQVFGPTAAWWDRADFLVLSREADSLLGTPVSSPGPPKP